jgi:mRNA-degrading endonuclease RelE of RelBE toxin-antitoxin system
MAHYAVSFRRSAEKDLRKLDGRHADAFYAQSTR